MDKKLLLVIFPVVFTANIFLLDFNTTIIAMPSIIDEFDLSLRLASWIILSASIIMTAGLMPIGRIADLLQEIFLHSFFIYFIIGDNFCELCI